MNAVTKSRCIGDFANMRDSKRLRWLSVGIALLHVGLILRSDWVHSPNDLEANLLPAGYLHLKYGRFDMAQVNPPLSRMVCAIPVVCGFDVTEEWAGLFTTPGSRPEYAVGGDFIEENVDIVRPMFFAARTMSVLFVLVGVWSVHRIAFEMHGGVAALIAVVVWCFSPMVMGHAATVNHDVPGAAMAALCCFAWFRLARVPRVPEAFLCGIASGLALLTRTTNAVLIMLWLGLFIFSPRRGEKRGDRPGRAALAGAVMCVALLLLNVGYQFSGTMMRLGEYELVSQLLRGSVSQNVDATDTVAGNRFRGTLLGRIPVPLPKDFVVGLDLQRRDFESPSFPSYLCGEWREYGWWYYYLFAWLIKTPIGFQLLLVGAVASWLRDVMRRRVLPGEGWLVASVLSIFTLASLNSRFTTHYRYVLPAFPFIAIFMARLWSTHGIGTFARRTCVGLLCYGVLSSLVVYPHGMSYFNESVGGPRNGGRYLLHSSCDWGQDMYYLAKWYENNRLTQADRIWLRCGGVLGPSLLGVRGERIPKRQCPQCGRVEGEVEIKLGTYVINVGYLYGQDPVYRYLDAFPPAQHIGYSIKVYRLNQHDIDTKMDSTPKSGFGM